jgi:hypothetical protein
MTQGPEFGRLEVVPLRSAWPREATNFTPWLAENLDRLSEALGLPLELIETEVDVSGFAADILARNPANGANVLIENQLENSDHGHLGQIMTYLAGLSTQTVIWVAPKFHDAHLSAVRWLNENTGQAFAFFAVELRVVRIGASPLAPIFDVIERPNTWNRSVRQTALEATERSDLGEFRSAFWRHFLARHPTEQSGGAPGATSSRWRPPTPKGFVVAQYLAKDGVGLWVRGVRGVANADTAKALEPYRDVLEGGLGVPLNSGGFPLLKKLTLDATDRANWDRMSDWLHEQTNAHVAALESLDQGPT